MIMSSHRELTIEQFTRQAAPFAQSKGHTDDGSLRLLIEMAELSADETVLDVACGTGIVACAFARTARRVTGVDLTPAMLEQARLLAAQLGLTNLSWREGDIETLPFPDASFTVVLSRYAFHHFLNPGVVLAEMKRVCQPGGRILIVDAFISPEVSEAFNGFEKLFDPSHNRALNFDEMLKLMKDEGLQKIRAAHYEMEMELESHLAASFPNQGDEEKLRGIFRADIGVNRLGVGAHWRNDKIHYAYPVTVFAAKKR